jgi:hypothetical protein
MAKINERDRQMYRERALKAADWFVNSQIKCERVWQSDHGRFLYYYFLPEKKAVPGLNWTHGRALFVLSEAYKLTQEKKYLDSMELGAHYMRALQPLDPYYPVTYGAFREEIPQSPRGGILDGAQAASGFLMLYRVTGNPDYLRRGRAFCDFLLRTWQAELSFPFSAGFFPERLEYSSGFVNAIHLASSIPLWHLYKITGEATYLGPLVASADELLMYQRADGGIRYAKDVSLVKEHGFNHHWGLGEGDDRYLLRNDDGLVTVALAAYQFTGNKKYLDAMVRYADWIVHNEPHERPYNAFGIQAANVLDIGMVAGKDYIPWVLEHLDQHCLALQAGGTGDPRAEGGFRGEDEEGNAGIFGGKALDYVPTRNTCYMTGLLFRLSGQGTGTGFSVFSY